VICEISFIAVPHAYYTHISHHHIPSPIVETCLLQ